MSRPDSADANISTGARKKTPGACERCREKRIKCDGAQPCGQCSKKGQSCVFTFSPSIGSDALADKLDLVLSRLDRLEQAVKSQNVYGQSELAQGKRKDPVLGAQSSWLAQLNSQTGCFEHYGRTSNFVVASLLGKRIKQLEEGIDSQPPQKRLRIGTRLPVAEQSHDMESMGLNDLTGFCDYVIPSNAILRQHRCLRSDVADRHIDCFFQTIHIFLPIFDVGKFREKYYVLRSLFGDNRLFVLSQDSHNRQQFLCLLYAVLALGALYDDEEGDNSSWASWYFAEAQEILGRLLGAVNFELVQAAMLMGAYAQHAIQPSLTYNLTGIASRLAFSIGLHIESTYCSAAFDSKEARRTWSLIYVQEVELSLDSGRPMSIQTSEIDMGLSISQPIGDDNADKEPCQVDFIQPLADIAQVIRRILNFVNISRQPENAAASADLSSVEDLRQQLLQWHVSLPAHLRFSYEGNGLDPMTKEAPCSWRARQHSSLRIHYNLAMIILCRIFLSKPASDRRNHGSYNTRQPETLYKAACIEAACDMIGHTHGLFTLAPSLRRWSYYCFYCLQATLVLLTKLTDDDRDRHENEAMPSPHLQNSVTQTESEGQHELISFCELSIKIFDEIELLAAKRCKQVVRKFLDKWESRQMKHKQQNKHKTRLDKADLVPNEHEPLQSDHDPSPSGAAEPDSHVRGPGMAASVTNSHLSSFPASSPGLATALDHTGRRESIIADFENGMNSAVGGTSTCSAPSTHSLGGLQAEFELYSTMHDENGFNMDNQLEMFPSHSTAEFGLDINEPTEYLLQVRRDLTMDEWGWFR